MDLLLLFILGIVISEYTEKKSKVVNIVNSVVFIIFSLLIFYGSNNSVITYAAQNTLDGSFYEALHTSLRYEVVIFSVHYSSYFAILLFLLLLSIFIGMVITVKIVKSFIAVKKEEQAEKLETKKLHFSITSNEVKFNKLYLIFGGFLS